MRVGRRYRVLTACALGATALTFAGCGGGPRQDSDEPSGTYPVNVVKATFPAAQRLAEKSELQIAVRNAGNKVIPNVAVTVQSSETDSTAAVQAFSEATEQPGVADPSRSVWVLDAGPYGGTTAYTNTWSLGKLKPGRTKMFVWKVTAVKPGVHSIKYEVAAGLDGKARAVVAGGNQRPAGQFTVRISARPASARVGNNGQVITSPQD